MASLDGIEPVHPEEDGYYRNTTIAPPPNKVARYENGVRDLNRLLASRKGFRGKSRSWAVYILCWYCRIGTQFSEDEIFIQAVKLGAKCVPPLSVAEVESAFKNSRKWGKLSNAKIATRLEITKKERAMKLFPPTPLKVKAAGPKKAEARHSRILQIVEKRGGVPTYSEVREELAVKFGIEVKNNKTIQRDYAALGIENPHTPGAGSQASRPEP